LVTAKNPDTPEPDGRAIARLWASVGSKYFDLSKKETHGLCLRLGSMPSFLKEILRLDCNTAYTRVRGRIASRRRWVRLPAISSRPAETGTRIHLTRLFRCQSIPWCERLSPSYLCTYLYGIVPHRSWAVLRGLPILNAPEQYGGSRLQLCRMTADYLAHRSWVAWGIEVLEAMVSYVCKKGRISPVAA